MVLDVPGSAVAALAQRADVAYVEPAQTKTRPPADSDPNNDVPGEDDQDDVIFTPQQADLALIKAVSDSTPNVGDTVTFTISVTNNGPDAATNVAVSDTLSNDFTYAGSILGGTTQDAVSYTHLTLPTTPYV